MTQGILPRVWAAILLLTLAGTLLIATVASAASSPAGVWTGTIKSAQGEEWEITLTLDKSGEDWSGTISDQLLGELQLKNVKVTDTRISFTFRPDNAPFQSNFSGSYIAADDRVTGSFSMRGASRFVKFRRAPGSQLPAVGTTTSEGIQEPARIRHNYKFAVTGRISNWATLHVVKDEVPTINTLTTSAGGMDGTLRYNVLDGFSIFLRGFRGGQNFAQSEEVLAQIDQVSLSSETYLKLDGFELGVMGYLGNLLMRNSKFNPYLTATVGQVSWALSGNGRGSDALVLERQPLQGDDLCAAGGIGTEYQISEKICLEAEWLWRYFMTKDTDFWPDVDNTWTNTHAWSLSLGVTYGFF